MGAAFGAGAQGEADPRSVAEMDMSRSRCRALPEPEGASATSRVDRRHLGRGCPAEASLNSPHRNQQRRSFHMTTAASRTRCRGMLAAGFDFEGKWPSQSGPDARIDPFSEGTPEAHGKRTLSLNCVVRAARGGGIYRFTCEGSGVACAPGGADGKLRNATEGGRVAGRIPAAFLSIGSGRALRAWFDAIFWAWGAQREPVLEPALAAPRTKSGRLAFLVPERYTLCVYSEPNPPQRTPLQATMTAYCDYQSLPPQSTPDAGAASCMPAGP